jgi:primosomal protein N' (replication factor Y)
VTNGGDEDLLPGMGDIPAVATPAKPSKPGKTPAQSGNTSAMSGKTPAQSGNTSAKSGKASANPGGSRQPAEALPVARVAVDTPLPHLDRPFDYLVPAKLDASAVPGCRVRVRFAGRLVDGYLLERVAESDHDGRLGYLERVTSPEAVLTPEIAALAREVADRYAGTLADVLRLAIPPRHARAESATWSPGGAAAPAGPGKEITGPGKEIAGPGKEIAGPGEEIAEPCVDGAGPWVDYPAGGAFLAALREGRAPRAVWTALPGPRWADAIAWAVEATLASGRGALVVVADGRDVARVDRALGERLGRGRHLALTAEIGPEGRYKRWLAVLRGQVTAVVGTRAAMFAPVRDLGLVVLWDDGDDVHAEPHAPYPHAREVLALRAHRQGAGALIGGFARTTDATQLVETGWAHPLAPDRTVTRRLMPQVRPAGSDAELARDEAARVARLPALAFWAARRALEQGPVLVQVPRRGYVPALACGRCRERARCGHCQGPLALTSAHAVPYCRWCGRIAGDWRCAECGNRQVRAVMVGAGRTAEELGRAFPGVTVRTSGRDGILAEVGAERALVVSTPGAEPVAAEGYAAALLLDGWVLLGRADLRAGEETLRRWMNAAALVRPGGEVVVVAEETLPAVQALLRWDPVTLAERELAERRELGFPPAARMASLTGSATALRELLDATRLPARAEVLGPVPVPGDGSAERALVRVPRADALALARALKQAQGVRSARKTPEVVRTQLDPLELL